MPTQQHNESPATFIRRMGWEVGTLIIGTETYTDGSEHTDIVELTAIGVHAVLARSISFDGKERGHTQEGSWAFANRDWTLHDK